MPTRQQRGQWAENLARVYLENQGLSWIKSRYRCQRGEIDLIMQEATLLIFIEVRYRASNYYGSHADSIDLRKQQRIILTAEHFLQNCTLSYSGCRFDALLIKGSTTHPQIQWVKEAFQA